MEKWKFLTKISCKILQILSTWKSHMSCCGPYIKHGHYKYRSWPPVPVQTTEFVNLYVTTRSPVIWNWFIPQVSSTVYVIDLTPRPRFINIPLNMLNASLINSDQLRQDLIIYGNTAYNTFSSCTMCFYGHPGVVINSSWKLKLHSVFDSEWKARRPRIEMIQYDILCFATKR